MRVSIAGPLSLGESAPADPGVRADDTVEQHDEGALGRTEPARQIDPHDARPAEADGETTIRAYDGPPEEARWGETRRTRADEELGLIGPAVHQVPRVRPHPVEPVAPGDLESSLGAQVQPVWTNAPDARVRDEESGGISGRGNDARED